MSTETPDVEAQPPAEPEPTPTQPTPAPEKETDWKAEARKWEARAKENSSAAEKLAELEKAQLSELERAKADAAEARAEADGYRLREQIAAWKAQVADATGVPAAALAGSTLDELQAHAEVLKPLVATPAPEPARYIVPTEGNAHGGTPMSQLSETDIEKMTADEINAARRAGRLNKLLGIS